MTLLAVSTEARIAYSYVITSTTRRNEVLWIVVPRVTVKVISNK